jgi:hypothetical protein
MIRTAILVTALLLPGAPAIAAAEQPPVLSDRVTSTSGLAGSMYRGKWYSPAAERARRCIIWRESHANYRAVNSSGHAGAYQFNDAAWRVSLTWMLLPEFRKQHQEVRALRAVPINRWPRRWQDAAFFTAWRDGAGRSHWHLAGSNCNALGVAP